MRSSPHCRPPSTSGRCSTTWTAPPPPSANWVAATTPGCAGAACRTEWTIMTTADAATARLPWDAADPYPFYESRRADGDVVWDDTAQAWLVLGYDAARQVLGGSEWTSDPAANAIARASMDAVSREFIRGSMLFADGANHERLRGSVRDVFTRSAVTGLTEGVEAIAATLIDGPPPDPVFDFMADIALPLPMAVIG